MTYKNRMRQKSPPWLQSGYGKSYVEGLGDSLDYLYTDYKDAIKARFPTEAAANGDEYALALIGDDSSLPKYPNEAVSDYGTRLQARWGRYARSGAAAKASDGTGCPILEDIEGVGFGDIQLLEYRDWPADATNPQVHHSPLPWYDSGGVLGIMVLGIGILGGPWWSRFWVFVGSYGGADISSGMVLGAGVLGTGVLGAVIDAEAVSAARKSMAAWKPAHTVAVSLTLLLDGTPIGSVLGVGVLGAMVLGAAGGLPGAVQVYINE